MSSQPPSTSGGDSDAGGEYVVVARRYRPQTFGELIGQEQVARTLTGAIETNRVGHAYLFTGARGVGKTSAARILAKALDCQQGPTPTPCNQCDICQSIGRGSDVDVLEIDGASNRGIDEIRQLRQNVNVRPSRARFKIYIIDEVHMLTKEAFNALLKTLEEPPEHVKFIFCTTEPTKIPITILSRCQRFDFAAIRSAEIQKRLAEIAAAEGVEAEPEALATLARRANGSMRDSQSLLEQLLSFGQQKITTAEVHALLGTASDVRLGALVDHLAARNAAAVLTELDAALFEGVEVGQLLEQLLGYFRDAMALGVGCSADALLFTAPSQQDQVLAIGRQLGLETILAVIQILEQTLSRLRYSTQGRTLAEIALVRIASLENLADVADLVAQLRSEGGLVAADQNTTHRNTSPAVASSTSAKKKADSELAPSSSIAPGLTATAPDSVPNTPAVELSDGTIRGVWQQALAGLAGLLADSAVQASNLAITAPNRLVVTFPAKYNSCKLFCETPKNLVELEAAVSAAAGQRVVIDMVLGATEASVTPEQQVVSTRQKLAEKADHPLVRRATELFDAQLVRVEPGGG